MDWFDFKKVQYFWKTGLAYSQISWRNGLGVSRTRNFSNWSAPNVLRNLLWKIIKYAKKLAKNEKSLVQFAFNPFGPFTATKTRNLGFLNFFKFIFFQSSTIQNCNFGRSRFYDQRCAICSQKNNGKRRQIYTFLFSLQLHFKNYRSHNLQMC